MGAPVGEFQVMGSGSSIIGMALYFDFEIRIKDHEPGKFFQDFGSSNLQRVTVYLEINAINGYVAF
jgi:hypothetical protein